MSTTEEVMDPQPTVYIRIGDSAIAFDTGGEILETVTYMSDGSPDWSEAGVCDGRGAGGMLGYGQLGVALEAAEKNASLAGYEVLRVPVPS